MTRCAYCLQEWSRTEERDRLGPGYYTAATAPQIDRTCPHCGTEHYQMAGGGRRVALLWIPPPAGDLLRREPTSSRWPVSPLSAEVTLAEYPEVTLTEHRVPWVRWRVRGVDLSVAYDPRYPGDVLVWAPDRTGLGLDEGTLSDLWTCSRERLRAE